jgi:hypothetical protein
VTGDRTRPTTLRGLAELLGCQHSALHKAVISQRLTAGVGFDADGRIVVTDARAAAQQWKDIHRPTTLEMIRRADRAQRAHVASGDDAITELDVLDFLAAVLVGAGVATDGAASFRRRTRAQIHSAKLRGWGDDAMVAGAVKLLEELIADPIPLEKKRGTE